MDVKGSETLASKRKSLEAAQEAVAKAQAEYEAAMLRSPAVEVATALHERMCHWNHTDGCGWFYEKEDQFFNVQNQYGAKRSYYLKATRLLEVEPDAEKLIKIIDAL